MYIIQTNTSINGNGVEIDFQSMMYKIPNKTWNEFKEYILSDEYETIRIIGTMVGSLKPRLMKVVGVLINDDFHLRVKFNNYKESKYYLVTDENFANLR